MLATLVACGHAPPAPHAEPAAPATLRLVAFGDDASSVIEVGAQGAVARKLDVPGFVTDVVYVGRDVAVLTYAPDGQQVGFVTAAGYTSIALPPASAWPEATGEGDPDHLWKLVPSRGELWVGKCRVTSVGDLGESVCLKRDFARIVPPSSAIVDREPTPDPPPYALETVAPPAWIQTGLVGEPPRLRCTDNGASVVQPQPAQQFPGRFAGVTNVHWIATSPPMFEATYKLENCIPVGDTCTHTLVFRGCELAEELRDAELVPGPHGTYAIATLYGGLSVRRRGRELGSVAGAYRHVAFLR